jgi:hypothetical protein
MSSRIAEKTLRRPVKRFLKRHGCPRSLAELRFFDRGIDIYALSEQGQQSYAVELKVVNWQKALRQAAIYQLCADFCYVAMPVEHTTKVDLEGFRNAGVGLLAVHLASNSVTEILPAKVSLVKHHFYSRSFQCSFESAGAKKANATRSA